MYGRYFRYLFENVDGGLFHSGSIYDEGRKETTNYIYMAGSYCRNTQQKRNPGSNAFQPPRRAYHPQEPSGCLRKDLIPSMIDLLIVGCYTAKYIKKLIQIIKGYNVKTVVLPYMAPIQRLVLAEEIKNANLSDQETVHFLQDPYWFLQKAGIERIYFLYGNGKEIHETIEELETGIHFEAADQRILRLIREMEGYEIPVVQAGYISENGWLFYFGIYGFELQKYSDFTRDYFSNIENIQELSNNIEEDYTNQLQCIVQEYLKKFGSSPATTVAMFEAPLHVHPNEIDSFMTEKEFSSREHCSIWEKYREDGHCSCMIRCVRDKDYDVMQRHRCSKAEESRFGILMLGNVNLNRYISEIQTRFWQFWKRLRGIGVPNCGSGVDWNGQVLRFSDVRDRIYWICSKHDITSAGVVSDIVLSSSNNRFLMVDEDGGCCLSGYIIPKEDIV